MSKCICFILFPGDTYGKVTRLRILIISLNARRYTFFMGGDVDFQRMCTFNIKAPDTGAHVCMLSVTNEKKESLSFRINIEYLDS